MSLGIAIQLYSVRQECERDLASTLGRLADIGYQRVEFDTLYGDPGAADRILESLGLSVCGLGVVLERLEDDPQRTIDACQALRTRRAMIAFAPRPVNREMAEGLRGRLDAAAATLDAHGIQLGYHSHYWEFEAWEHGKRPIDIIAQARRIYLEPDLGWVWQAGFDPVQFLREHRGRCPIAHIKDFATRGDQDSDRAVGAGALPSAEIVRQAPSLGVETLVVEFNRPDGPSPFDTAQRSLKYIRARLRESLSDENA